MTNKELIDKILFLIDKEKEARENLRDAPSKIFNTGRISGMMDVIKLIQTKEI